MGLTIHFQKDNHGQPVIIKHPSVPTPLENWAAPAQVATVIPEGDMPADLNGLPFQVWTGAQSDWNSVPGQADIEEPPFVLPPGKKPAAGAVIVEQDGRVWVVCPSNKFGGYSTTYPKGRQEHGLSLQATAIREAHEESGLQVQLIAFLADSTRSETHTRYYLARRVGGNPASMGWESQAVMLVPRKQLADVLAHKNDQPLVRALDALLPLRPVQKDILKYFTLTSGHRILAAIHRFRRKYGTWPHRVLVDAGVLDALRKEVLTPQAWALLATKLELVAIPQGRIIAEGHNGARVEYDGGVGELRSGDGPYVDEWIWGTKVAQ